MSEILPPVVAHLMGDINHFRAKMGEADAIMAKTSISGAEKWMAWGKKAMVGGGIIAGAAAAIGVKLVNEANDFDARMERIHTMADAGQSEVDAMKSKVLGLSSATGIAANDVADSLYHIESAGYRGAAATDVLTNAMHLSMMTGASAAETTYGLTSIMQTYGAKTGEAAKYAALFSATVGAGDMTMEAFNRAVGTGYYSAGQTFGVTSQSLSAALAFVTDRGAHADEAATRLRMTLALIAAPSAKAAKMLTAIGLSGGEVKASTSTMTEALKKAGLSTVSLAEDLKKPDGLYVALHHLQTALKQSGLSAEAANALLSHAFGGGKSDATMLAMLNNLDTIPVKYKLVVHGISEYGEHVKAAQATAKVQTDAAKASLHNLGIEVGEVLSPYVATFMGWIKKASDYLGQHKEIVKLLAAVLIGVFVVGLLIATAGLIAFVGAFIAANFAVFAWIVIIGLVVLAVIYVWTHWKQIWGWIVEHAKQVGHWLSQTWDAVKADIVQAWGGMLDWIKGKWGELTGWFASGWGDITGATSSGWSDITGAVTDGWNAVTGWLSSAWHTATDPIVQAWHTVADTTVRIWNGITGFFKKWWPLLLVIFDLPLALLIGAWNRWHTQIINAVHTAWTIVTTFLKVQWNNLVTIAKTVWGFLVGLWTGFNNLLQSVARAVWDWISSHLKAAWAAIVALAKAEWNLFYTNVVAPVERAANAVGHWLSWLWGRVKFYFGLAVGFARAEWNAFYGATIQPVINAAHAVATWMGNIGNSVHDGFWHIIDLVRNLWNEFWNIGGYIMQGLWSGITNWFGTIESGVGNFLGGMLGWAKHILDIHSPSGKFRDEVGQWIPKGVAVGIDLHSHVAESSVAKMASKIRAAGQVAMTSGMTLPPLNVSQQATVGAVNASSVNVVHATVNVEAKVNDDVLFRTTQRKSLQYQKRNGTPAFSF